MSPLRFFTGPIVRLCSNHTE